MHKLLRSTCTALMWRLDKGFMPSPPCTASICNTPVQPGTRGDASSASLFSKRDSYHRPVGGRRSFGIFSRAFAARDQQAALLVRTNVPGSAYL